MMYSVLVSLFKEKNRGMSSRCYRYLAILYLLSSRRLSVQAPLVDVRDVLYRTSALLFICFRSHVRIYDPFQSESSRDRDANEILSIKQSETMGQKWTSMQR